MGSCNFISWIICVAFRASFVPYLLLQYFLLIYFLCYLHSYPYLYSVTCVSKRMNLFSWYSWINIAWKDIPCYISSRHINEAGTHFATLCRSKIQRFMRTAATQHSWGGKLVRDEYKLNKRTNNSMYPFLKRFF